MASTRPDAYAEPLPPPRAPRAALPDWTIVAGSVALPMLLALSLASLAWALPANGDSAMLAALGLSGIVLAVVACAVWVVAASIGARSREMARLRAEQRALEAELAAIAHDLRAPLVTANSYFELLAEEAFGRLPADAVQAARRGGVASERARSLAESALRRALRRNRDGAEPAASVNVGTVLDEVLIGLRADLAGSAAEVEVRNLPAARCDAQALYRVFANLIENAIKYAPPGRRPHILVSGYREGEFVQLAVRDWGIGIARREQEQVFALYERAGEAGGAAAGAGIGLATVRQLVQEQGGRVWIDPLVADGTCVRVALPAAA